MLLVDAAGHRGGGSQFETTPFGKMAFFKLPCHKTDTIRMCITRSHPCMCADGLSHLCPYRTLEQFIIRTTTQRGTVGAEDSFLFPGANCGAVTRHARGDDSGLPRCDRGHRSTTNQTCRPTGAAVATLQRARLPRVWSTVPHPPRLPRGDGATYRTLGQRCSQALRPGHSVVVRRGIYISQDHRQPHPRTEGHTGHGQEVPRNHLRKVLDQEHAGAPQFSTENIHSHTYAAGSVDPHRMHLSGRRPRATSANDASSCRRHRPSPTSTVTRRRSGTPPPRHSE